MVAAVEVTAVAPVSACTFACLPVQLASPVPKAVAQMSFGFAGTSFYALGKSMYAVRIVPLTGGVPTDIAVGN